MKPFDLGSIWPAAWRRRIVWVLQTWPLVKYILKWCVVAVGALAIYYWGVFVGGRP